jgi:hypothetical protein
VVAKKKRRNSGPDTEPITVYVPLDVYSLINKYAARERRSISGAVLLIVTKFLEKEKDLSS